MTEIQKKLFEHQDLGYRDFSIKLIPNIPPEKIIGVRSPVIKKLAREISSENYVDEFLNSLPHKYHEENAIHGGLLCIKYKDINALLEKLDEFLPYVDNWAISDGISPALFKKYPDIVYDRVLEWIKSDITYVRRFAIGTLLSFYLGENFKPEQLEIVADSTNDEYYVNMMVAWYFSIALVKQYDFAIKYIEEKRLEPWTHNKAIQKAIESRQIGDERKQYLRTLKVKKSNN